MATQSVFLHLLWSVKCFDVLSVLFRVRFKWCLSISPGSHISSGSSYLFTFIWYTLVHFYLLWHGHISSVWWLPASWTECRLSAKCNLVFVTFLSFFWYRNVDCLKYIYLSVVSVFFLCCNLVDSILVLAFQLPVCRSFFHFMIANQSLFCSHYCKCFNRAIELIFSSFWQNNSAFLSSQILIK